jgi:hypothetical protein
LNFALPELTCDPFKKAMWSFGMHTFTVWLKLSSFKNALTYCKKRIRIYFNRLQQSKSEVS